LITPEGVDNALLEENDLVLVRNDTTKDGKRPANESALHAAIYAQHAAIHAIFSAAPANVAAFASAKERFETSTVPESYYMLRAVTTRSMEDFLGDPAANAACFSEKTPVVLFENSRLVTTGASLFTALDRLEVAEATAASILVAREAGKVIFLSEGEIQALKTTFHLE
jgi:L-fuculose-phosphate aldolase